MPDTLGQKLAAQVRIHTAALDEIREACHGQRVTGLDHAYFELGRAIYRLEVAVVHLEAHKEVKAL